MILDQYKVTDLMAEKVDALLDEIYKDGSDPQESYTLDTSGLDEKVKAEAACGAKWDKKQRTVLLINLMQQAENLYLQERKMVLPLIRTSWQPIFS